MSLFSFPKDWMYSRSKQQLRLPTFSLPRVQSFTRRFKPKRVSDRHSFGWISNGGIPDARLAAARRPDLGLFIPGWVLNLWVYLLAWQRTVNVKSFQHFAQRRFRFRAFQLFANQAQLVVLQVYENIWILWRSVPKKISTSGVSSACLVDLL